MSPVKINEIGKFTEIDDVVLLSTHPKGSKEQETFAKVAESLRNDYSFGAVESPSIVLYKKFDEGFAKFEGEPTEEAITSWIKRESIPLMAEIGQDNYEKYMTSGLPLAFLFYGNADQRKDIGAIVEKVMKPHKGKVNAVYIDASKFASYGESLNLEKEWPGFVIHDIENDLKYPFPAKEKITEEALTKFVAQFVVGELKPKYKSEPIPKSDDGPVKVVVHETFEKIVFDEKTDVLLEIYAPWCGACKRIAPTLEKVAAAYNKKGNKIVIAKMDGTANDLPKAAKIKLEKFPTIFLFKASSNEKVEMENASDDPKVFIDFISQHATNKVTIDAADIEAGKKDAAKEGDHDEL